MNEIRMKALGKAKRELPDLWIPAVITINVGGFKLYRAFYIETKRKIEAELPKKLAFIFEKYLFQHIYKKMLKEFLILSAKHGSRIGFEAHLDVDDNKPHCDNCDYFAYTTYQDFVSRGVRAMKATFIHNRIEMNEKTHHK